MPQRSLSAETLAAQALGDADPLSGGLAPVINPSTNYEQRPDGSYRQDRVYTRADNPTSEQAERLLAALEGGAGGGAGSAHSACVLFGSGMAAATAVFQSLLPGDHVLVSRVLYWGVRKWLAEFALTWGLDVEFTDTCEPEAVAAAIRPGRTRLLWVETPANPMWEITDLTALCELGHTAGARVAVDNTVATPVLTRPFEFGADLVVHSATKYLNGHGDVLAGAVLAARRDPFWERIRSWRRNAGAMLGPFEAWLLLRGMRTLFLRVHRASETALAIATRFEGHPALSAVLYPGLPSHPGHQIAARQMRGGFGGMLSFRLAGGAADARAVRGPPEDPGDLAEAARRVLDAEINPAIAAHHGHVSLADAGDGWIRVRLEGGCQGCSLAEVTLRQGIEPILRARLPGMTGLADVTDHEAGTDPFFSAEKR